MGIGSLIGIGNFKRGPKPEYFLRKGTICGRTQRRALQFFLCCFVFIVILGFGIPCMPQHLGITLH